MSEALQEYVDSRSQRLRVDREAGIIRGVKLLGLTSRNGRRYRESALAEAVGLYEGAKVNVNHPKGHPLSPRDYQDRLGVIRHVAYRAGEGLFGDLHCNPKHALSEQLLWDAEHAPQNVGLSHNVLARTARDGDETVVEAIAKVQSIDLVADPATTAGLFEHEESQALSDKSQKPAEGDSRPALDSKLWTLDSLTLEALQRHRPDLVGALRNDQESELAELRSRVDRLTASEAAARRRERIVELLEAHGLPRPASRGGAAEPIVSPQFLQTLLQADDDASLERLIEERAALLRSACEWATSRGRGEGRPQSRDQAAVQAADADQQPRSAAEFAAAIRGR